MSSNGLVLFFGLSVGTLFIPSSAAVQPFSFGLALAFALLATTDGLTVVRRAAVSVVPLAIFLTLVWVVIVGRAPDATLLYRPDASVSAWQAVAALTSRLFLLAVFTLGTVRAGAAVRPGFVLGLAAPRSWKVVLLSAASLAEVMRQGAQRAHTALVVANILTPWMSLRNLRHGWLLFRTTWVAAIGIAMERLDTKWAYENLPDSAPLDRGARLAVTRRDIAWVGAALLAMLATAATTQR